MATGLRGPGLRTSGLNMTFDILPVGSPEYKEDLKQRGGGLLSGRDSGEIEQWKGLISTGQLSDQQIQALAHRNPGAADELLSARQSREFGAATRAAFDPKATEFQQATGPVEVPEYRGPVTSEFIPAGATAAAGRGLPGLIENRLQAGDLKTAMALGKLAGPEAQSSRYKFGQVTNRGTIAALDTQTGKTVEFENPEGVTIDRPMFSFKQVSPEGEETQTFGPRGSFLGGGARTVKTSQSQTEKAAFEQRAARGIISRARNLTSQLWTAKNNLQSRYGQAADLYIKQFTQSDPRVAQYDSLREALMAPLIRALGEKGTLAEGDVGRARNLWPKFTDSKEVAEGKLNQVEAIWDGVLTGKFESLDSAISETSENVGKNGTADNEYERLRKKWLKK